MGGICDWGLAVVSQRVDGERRETRGLEALVRCHIGRAMEGADISVCFLGYGGAFLEDRMVELAGMRDDSVARRDGQRGGRMRPNLRQEERN